MSTKSLGRILLVCREEAYEHYFQDVYETNQGAGRYEELALCTGEDETYAGSFDILFIFSSDPASLIKYEQQREHEVDWTKKRIIFVTPASKLESSRKILHLPVSGLISLEKFTMYGDRALDIVIDHAFLLEPELNFYVADSLMHHRRKGEPAERLKLIKEEVDAPLRKAEMDILQLLLDGRTTKEMAEMLYYSVKTVKRYISNLIRVVGTADRTGIIVHAIRAGWVKYEK
ncbi:LuxR C-terminal-related transcriptional regulator [Alkalicoccus chagannorensis]|uniref:LuxR C-terminal-related transcriptional regulator n=1 Tax=Alkalicoccus chagannorensis TaxID=427072 RepID=UPI00041C1F10|nr:LuxR C-terminal-related transcriptional regulator [Alkalicoccus chagannorensis]